MSRSRASALIWLALSACAPHVGDDCPPEALMRARTIVHRTDGLPAYAGQSLMISSCGGGPFCHSEGAPQRFGAPADMNFDPELADQVVDPVHGAARLRRAQLAIFENRDDIWWTILGGTMPPGAVGHSVQQPLYEDFDDPDHATRIAGLDTPEGRETLRNWLACGAPVIERTGGLGSATACSSDDDCPLTGRCVLASRTCQAVGDTVPYLVVPIEPTWSSIYSVVIGTRCATASCHGGSAPAADLDLSDATRSRTALLSAMASPNGECAGEGALIAMNDPDHSLFYRKLTDNTICGGLMPRGGGTLAMRYQMAIHDWIAAGAPP